MFQAIGINIIQTAAFAVSAITPATVVAIAYRKNANAVVVGLSDARMKSSAQNAIPDLGVWNPKL